jgi:uncharacterized membrane protein YgdD (TMEM256/DUF423 family)
MSAGWFATGAAMAALGVALGAFGAHGLKSRVSPEMVAVWETGVRYHLVHALGLLGVAMAVERWPAAGLAGWLFVLGTLVFSGSLYVLVLSGQRWLGAITPLGGLAFVAGWLALAWVAVRK